MTIYLIGPSGVGKTSCARRASRLPGVEHLDLDDLCRGNESNWMICGPVLTNIESRRRDSPFTLRIVDIGAGTQTLPQLRDYLSGRRERVVLIWGPESEVVQRNPLGPGRALDEYRQTEYLSRQFLYSIAPYTIDVTGMREAEVQVVGSFQFPQA